ncbi:MAG: hypothetical protein Ct9H300mP2_1280 [Candidatus Neomarinimicrobiota bacterium]|nr:MAG: hypothetical protein Ct9H300mP2_1280 [Candidatus Neomarinimicrobiota bacterium]
MVFPLSLYGGSCYAGFLGSRWYVATCWFLSDLERSKGQGKGLRGFGVKFRGQVRPYHKKVTYKIDIKKLIKKPSCVIWGDGELYADDRIIYSAKSLQVGLFEILYMILVGKPGLDAF